MDCLGDSYNEAEAGAGCFKVPLLASGLRAQAVTPSVWTYLESQRSIIWDCLDSQVAGNNRPPYPKVDHYWFKVAHNYESLALQVLCKKNH